jgi:ribonucleoside-diphosphate reductase alpha chain
MERLAFMPNSPTLMNAGDELQQLSACFVISPDDDIYDIHDTAREAAEVFQSGGGMGYGFWTLRPKGEAVGSTGGVASGPITFMRTFDQMCETIAQGGMRRGAQMGVMKVDHPDVIEFIHAKRKDVSLAETLRLNDPDDFTHNSFEGALEEAREILDSGEVPNYLRNAMEGHLSNFNISVGVTDDFMDAVKNDETFTMRHPSTGEEFEANHETVKMYELYGYGEYVEEGEVIEIPAREIWQDIIEGAHENGEPGTVFIDRFNKKHSFPVDLDEPLQDQEYAMLATNPCGEQPLMEYEACNLGHINLSTIVSHDLHNWSEFENLPKHEGKSLEERVEAFLDTAINWNEFNHRIEVGTNFLDNVVTMSDFPVPEIEESVRKNRKIGLGIMGLAQLYIQLGVEYGSQEANEIGRQLMTHINHESKWQSHELALERGSFENWEDSKYEDPKSYSDWFEHHTGQNVSNWPEGFKVRNHNTTTVAPTGTTSMIGNTSGGCEPIYSVANFKNVSGDIQGDDMLVQFDSLFLRTLEENDIDIDEVKQEATEILQADEWEGPEQLESVPDELSELFVTTGDLTALEHGAVQCAIQEGVDSAISKTVNAPNDASLEDAKTAFEYVYDNGGKGVTYYRDGTRSKQVLTTSSTTGGETSEENPKSSEEIAREYLESEYGMSLSEVVESPQTGVSEENMVGGTRERPNTLEGQTYRVETGYGRMYVTVNDLEDEPFEILATIGKSGGQMESMLEGICRMVSASFRSGMKTEEVIEQLRGIRSPKVGYDNGEQVQSIPDGIAKVLVRHTGKKPWLQESTASPIQKSDGGTEMTERTSKNLEKPDQTDQLSKNVRPESDGDECPECHKMTLKMTEGCKTCETCGWSAC